MTVGVPQFHGARLKEARLSRGLFKNALADMVGVTGTAIARYEDGTDRPKADKLEAIAGKLGFPTGFFLRPAWPERLDPVFWRSLASETKSAREMTEQRMYWLCEIFAFFEEDVNFPGFSLPTILLPDDYRLITSEIIEDTAEELRQHWKLGHRPVPDMTLALENVGIPVVNLEIASDKQDGFCFRSERLERFFVGVNTYNVSAARARFDLAHELGHAVLHRNVSPQQTRDPVLRKMIEEQAHRFAGAFLFPRRRFIDEVGECSLDYFSNAKKNWGMSIAAMIYRARDLGLIDDDEKTALYKGMGKRRWRGPLREPFDAPHEMPLERPRMLRRGLTVVLEGGIFGRATFRAAVALPGRELEQLIGVDAGYLDGEEVAQLRVTSKNDGVRAVDLESGNVVEFPKGSRVARTSGA